MKKIYLSALLSLFISSFTFAQYVLNVVATPVATSCNSGWDGSVTVNATSGVPPYLYAINGSAFQASNIFTGLPAGQYSVEARDANLNNGYANFSIADGDSIRVTAHVITPSCTGSGDGLVNFSFANGVPPYRMSYINGWGYSWGSPNDYWADFAAGSYLFTLDDSIGCVGQLIVIVPDGLPAFTHAGNDTTICSGGSIQLSGSNSATLLYPYYQWTPSTGLSNDNTLNPLATPAATTTYVLMTSAGSNYCTTYDTITIAVANVQTPIIELNGQELIIINPQPSATYSWQQLNGATWEDVVPAATGNSYIPASTNQYRVKATILSCNEAYSCSLQAGRPASRNAYGIYMYPNPATDVLKVDGLKVADGWQTLEIISLQGIRVLPIKNIKNQQSVSVYIDQLSSGIYLVKLTRGNDETTEWKIIKK